ncbi:ATP-binding protein [Agromyces arachidis]|uniref:ATP-binding protein n=1 Tax=Agromyces arachidis TaxID=766966 RepID=UPI0040577961
MLGRRREQSTIAALVDRAREGRGGALVVVGDAGIGKTSLVEHAIAGAGDFRIPSAIGVESERELAFAGLQQILSAIPDAVDRLPGPQRQAIRVALGQAVDPVPRPFVLGLAVLGLLVEVSRDRPLLCVVDDVHWLDASSVQVLGFVARRLERSPIAMIFVRRVGLEVDDVDGIPVLPVEGLEETDARAFLRTVVGGPMDEQVLVRILQEAGGNPLMLREAATAGFLRPEGAPETGASSLPMAGRLQRAFAARIARLSEASADVLLLAAADPTGDPRLVARAATGLGRSIDDLVAAEAAGLVHVGQRIAFDHPLVRSAAYGAASTSKLRRVHAALADATDRQRDPDRRAWHQALGTFGPSESVAAALEQSAGRAGARGGFLAAAAFYERAMGLAESPATRVRCAIAGATALELAGAQPRAMRLLDEARSDAEEPLDRARLDVVRGRLLFTLERSARPVELFLAAADALVDHDPMAAREAYLDAMSAAVLAAPGEDGVEIRKVAERARRAPRPAPDELRSTDRLLEVMREMAIADPVDSLPLLRRHLEEFSDVHDDPGVRARWLWIASRLAVIGWDERRWSAYVDEGTATARAVGALTAVAATTTTGVALHLLRGDATHARQLAAEAVEIWDSIAVPRAAYGVGAIVAWEGGADGEAALAAALEESSARGEGMARPFVHWGRALHAVGGMRYDDALPHALAAARYPIAIVYSTWGLVEAVEAAARSGDRSVAIESLRRLAVSTLAAGTDWARGVHDRSAALVAGAEDEAERLHVSAIDHLSRTGLLAESARAHLVYGEWLRRHRRRGEARAHLERAEHIFTSMGARGFSHRAASEVAALRGGSPSGTDSGELSTQEMAVARLASEGLTNAAIATRLHLSASTVDYHLRKAFRKLGIASRARLHLALAERDHDEGGLAASDR